MQIVLSVHNAFGIDDHCRDRMHGPGKKCVCYHNTGGIFSDRLVDCLTLHEQLFSYMTFKSFNVF